MMVGTIDDYIYKLSAQFTADNLEAAEAVFWHAIGFCIVLFGDPEKQASTAMWRTSFGNVIIDQHSRAGYHCVNFNVTSRELVRAAKPLKSRSGCLGLLALIAVPAVIYFLLR